MKQAMSPLFYKYRNYLNNLKYFLTKTISCYANC